MFDLHGTFILNKKISFLNILIVRGYIRYQSFVYFTRYQVFQGQRYGHASDTMATNTYKTLVSGTSVKLFGDHWESQPPLPLKFAITNSSANVYFFQL